MAHPDERAEHEATAIARQFQMPRTRDGHGRVHKIDTYGRQRKKNQKAALEEAFRERLRDINEHLSPALLGYMDATLAEARRLRDPNRD